MALPTSGALSISMIRTALGTSNGSLRYLSGAAGKSTPDAISEFYGYNPAPTCTIHWYNTSYGGSLGSNLYIYINGSTRIADYAIGDSRGGTFTINQGDSVTVYLQASGGNYAYAYSHYYRYSTGDYPFSQGNVGIDPYVYYSFTADQANLDIVGFVDYP